MWIATLVRPCQAARLDRALSSSHTIVAAGSWGLLEAMIRAKPIATVVFDPNMDQLDSVSIAEKAIQKYPSVPFIAYLEVDAPSMRAVARLAKAGLQDVVLLNVDDSPEQLSAKIDAISFSPLTQMFVRHLQPFLADLPAPVARAVEKLFQAPNEYVRTEDLAIAASVTLSCLYRSFKTARLASPKKFLTGARILRGYKYLLEPSFSVAHAAAKAGYPSCRIFAQHIREIFGVPPSELRRSVMHDEALSTLCRWLTGPDHLRRCDRKILSLSHFAYANPRSGMRRVRPRRAVPRTRAEP